MTAINTYPAAPAADVAFLGDALDARFLKDGDVIERGGACITIVAAERNDVAGVTGIAYRNESGGIQSARIPHGIMVPIGTLI